MENNLLSNKAKNKMLFYIATAVLALFLMISVVPAASALGDITPPDDVENLEIELYDGAAMLSWDVTTDDTEVTGYMIYSGPEAVTAEEGEYSYEVIDAKDVIEFLVEDLPNGDTIYFTVTAYDADGNESVNYSDEVYGTPEADFGPAPEAMHMAADEEPPTVTNAVALDMETVQVEFSEAIVLPPLSPEAAFNLMDTDSEILEVLSVEMDPDDVVGTTVLITTETQEGGTEYILTASIEIEDTAGNPVISGTSDTAAFIGSTIEPGSDLIGDLPEDDFDAPTIANADSTGATSIQIVFSEGVILDSDATANFFIAEEGDASMQLEVLSVELDETGTVADLETSEQADVVYSVIITGVMDEAGNEMSLLDNSSTFDGNMVIADVELPDTDDVDVLASGDDDTDADDDDDDSGLALTPENVKSFVAAVVSDIVVKLTWDKVDDPSVIDQILYKSTDGGSSYDSGTSLGADREEVDVTGLTPGTEYYFKLTTMNADGYESEGMITSIMLPETGMGVGLMVGASLGLAALNRRRKNKK